MGVVCSLGGVGSVVMTTVTLDRPFSYSTSTWQDGGCQKDVSKFLPHTQHSAGSSNVDETGWRLSEGRLQGPSSHSTQCWVI